jgi:glycosyltransferase involved in cell wall biosynthesis
MQHLGQASVCVMPSLVEPFGLSAFEALALGVPSVIPRDSGLARLMAKDPFRTLRDGVRICDLAGDTSLPSQRRNVEELRKALQPLCMNREQVERAWRDGALIRAELLKSTQLAESLAKFGATGMLLSFTMRFIWLTE